MSLFGRLFKKNEEEINVLPELRTAFEGADYGTFRLLFNANVRCYGVNVSLETINDYLYEEGICLSDAELNEIKAEVLANTDFIKVHALKQRTVASKFKLFVEKAGTQALKDAIASNKEEWKSQFIKIVEMVIDEQDDESVEKLLPYCTQIVAAARQGIARPGLMYSDFLEYQFDLQKLADLKPIEESLTIGRNLLSNITLSLATETDPARIATLKGDETRVLTEVQKLHTEFQVVMNRKFVDPSKKSIFSSLEDQIAADLDKFFKKPQP